MVGGRMLLLGASCWLLVVLGRCSEQTNDGVFKTQEEKELIEALQDVLEKLQSKDLPSTEKKQSWLPACDAGQLCALRKGSRIGKLCGCAPGTVCNFTVLKCL